MFSLDFDGSFYRFSRKFCRFTITKFNQPLSMISVCQIFSVPHYSYLSPIYFPIRYVPSIRFPYHSYHARCLSDVLPGLPLDQKLFSNLYNFDTVANQVGATDLSLPLSLLITSPVAC